MNKKRSLNNLADIIGSVTKKHEQEIQNENQEISLRPKKEEKPIRTEEFSETNAYGKDDSFTHTAEFSVTEIRGLNLQSRVAKVPESFKIKPSLKKIVEEIVQETRSRGQNISKGEIYNLLIAKGLQGLK